MDRARLPSADRSQVEDRLTAIDVTVSGLELPGFGLGRVFGPYDVASATCYFSYPCYFTVRHPVSRMPEPLPRCYCLPVESGLTNVRACRGGMQKAPRLCGFSELGFKYLSKEGVYCT